MIELVSINPPTGTMSTVGTLVGASVVRGVSALDAQGQRYFFTLAGNNLTTVDTQTGAVITSLSTPSGLGSMEFDPTVGDDGLCHGALATIVGTPEGVD